MVVSKKTVIQLCAVFGAGLAAFGAAAQYSVTATVNIEGSGFIEGLASSYQVGEIAEIRAVANDGYWFYRWECEDIDPTLAYSPTLKLDGSAEVTAVFGQAIYVSPSGVTTADGSSWANATTISNAIALAEAGNVVVISNGTYTANISTFINVTNAVAVRGFTGNRDDVIIDGKDAYILARLSGSGALLADLTLTRGKPNGGTPGSLYMAAGTVASNIRVYRGNADAEYDKYSGICAVDAVIVDCLLDENHQHSSRLYEGYVLHITGASLVARCEIIGNSATKTRFIYDACPVYINGASAVVRDCIIAGNSYTVSQAMESGQTFSTGVRVNSGYLVNSAVIDNVYYASTPLSVSGAKASGAGKVINCILKNNDYSAKGNERNWIGTASCFTNCYTTDDGNLLDATVIKPVSDADYVYANGRITLPFGSPLIDAGADLEALNLGKYLVDMNNAKRISGSAIDVGPAEFQKASLNCSFSAPVYVAKDKIQTTLTALVDGEDLDGLTYAWDTDGDGAVDVSGADKAAINIEITALGETTVTLTVSNSNGDSAEYSTAFTVNPSTLYVVPNNPDAEVPYASWHTAAATIADAVNTATDGSTIILTNGIHYAKDITIGKMLTLRGATGNFNDSIIDGRASGRVLMVKNIKAIVADLTVRNGRAHRTTSGIYNDGGTVTNCHITANRAYDNDAPGVGVNNVNGKIIDCLIDGNYGDNRPYGAGIMQSGVDALTERCIITNNYSVGHLTYGDQVPGASINGGVIRNSLIAYNWVSKSVTETATRHAAGLLIKNARAENCTIIGNRTGALIDGTNVSGINGSNSQIINCLIADNLTGDILNNWVASTLTYTNCCTTRAAELNGKDNRDFTDNTYRLLPNGFYTASGRSPLLNGGVSMPWAETTTDILGNRRIFAGGKIDIGCIEIQKSPGLSIIVK